MHTPSNGSLPSPYGPTPASPADQSAGRSKWLSFRAFPMVGQVAIWFGAVLAVLLGVGIVGAIAAPPEPEPIVAAAPVETSPVTVAASTTSTTTVATTVPATAVPPTTVAPTTPPTAAPTTLAAVVLTAEVVDGDTIEMSDGSTVRLIGIDTPERGKCGFEEATAVLVGLLDGQGITLVPGARDDVDKYGRLLRYVEANGVDVDLKMIESGRAIARYDGRDGYGVHPRQDAYVQADELSPSLNVCASTAPVPVAVVPVADTPVATVPVAAVPATAPPAANPAPAGVHYQNCTEVRAAGAAPIYAGDPGWQTKFDRDGDGVGCE